MSVSLGDATCFIKMGNPEDVARDQLGGLETVCGVNIMWCEVKNRCDVMLPSLGIVFESRDAGWHLQAYSFNKGRQSVLNRSSPGQQGGMCRLPLESIEAELALEAFIEQHRC